MNWNELKPTKRWKHRHHTNKMSIAIICIVLVVLVVVVPTSVNAFAAPSKTSLLLQVQRHSAFSHRKRGKTPTHLLHSRRHAASKSALHSSLLGGAALFDNPSNAYFLSRIIFLRALAFVYAVAFLIAKDQNRGLIGDRGIAPARDVLNAAEKRGRTKRSERYRRQSYIVKDNSGSYKVALNDNDNQVLLNTKLATNIMERFQYLRERLWDRVDALGRPVTTLLWLAPDRNNLNPWLDLIANCGLLLSMAVFTLGAANVPLLGGLWVCQRSLMAVGGAFYGFGWESQLAELGFHAIFLVPLLSLNPVPAMAPPTIVLWAIRWHLFRIMIGAGLIKLRAGDAKWKLSNLSAMDYFYETQPVPNPLTRYMHWAPKAWHKFEVLSNHFVELVAPWLLFFSPFPSLRRMGGIIQLMFQAILISTGNLSFLNWLTCVPAILCLDDQMLANIFPYRLRNMAALAASHVAPSTTRQFASMSFGVLVATLSIPVVKNLMSKNQLMNASFDPLRLISTYGAFGAVEEERYEFIVSAAHDIGGPWEEYSFRVKPGDVTRRPKFISPYHHRLDWQMWIASACQTLDRSPWMYTFLLKLLKREPDVVSLLEKDPFEGQEEGPKYIRIDKYRYSFHKGGKSSSDSSRKPAPYWDREFIKRVFPRQGIANEVIIKDVLKKIS